MKDWRHVFQRVVEHEKSDQHCNCVEAHDRHKISQDISGLLGTSVLLFRKDQVNERRKVLVRVIETIKLIGKRGLSYRGKRNESGYTLHDENKDHGNFLEILRLIGKFDPTLQIHLENVVKKSKERLPATTTKEDKKRKGRGGTVTLISKTTVNYIIEIIRKLIKDDISREIRNAGMFSIQLDTTQDVSVSDQCIIIVRYVTDKVHERMISLVKCTSSTGQSMFEMLRDELQMLNIDIGLCVGNSTDGAANMQAEYKCFSKWCCSYADARLVLRPCTQSCPDEYDRSQQRINFPLRSS